MDVRITHALPDDGPRSRSTVLASLRTVAREAA